MRRTPPPSPGARRCQRHARRRAGRIQRCGEGLTAYNVVEGLVLDVVDGCRHGERADICRVRERLAIGRGEKRGVNLGGTSACSALLYAGLKASGDAGRWLVLKRASVSG